MIKIEEIKQLKLLITWRLLYLGFCQQKVSAEDIIEFAIEKLQEGDDRSKVCELAGTYVDEKDDICNILQELMEGEDTQQDLESRKLRIVIVDRVLKSKSDNCINGLMDLTDLWIELGYPEDSPHIIQGKDNNIPPNEYFTVDNYNMLYKKNIEWIGKELDYLYYCFNKFLIKNKNIIYMRNKKTCLKQVVYKLSVSESGN